MSKLLDKYAESLRTTLTDSKSQLQLKEIEVPEETKLKNIPDLIEKIDNKSKVELLINAPDYEGQELTATKDKKSFKGTVTEGQCRIAVDEEGIWKVSAKDGSFTEIETDMTFETQLNKCTIYGVKVIETESDPEKRLVYTDDAIDMTPVEFDWYEYETNYHNWKTSWIFDKVYPVMLKTDGTIDYRLNPDDQTLKADGGESDISNMDYDGNAMVCVEKFYTKYSMDGDNEWIQISDNPKEGFEPLGFIREDGSEADCFFLPMFTGCFDNDGKLRSLADQDMKFSVSWEDFRTAAKKNGSNYDIESWVMSEVFQNFYYILMKNCNYKKALYYGKDRKVKTTGQLKSKDAISVDAEGSSQTTKFLWIEDFTTNYDSGITRFETGLLGKNNEIYIRMKPPYSGTDTSTYEKASDYISPKSSGNITQMKCDNKYGRIPIKYQGSETTYEVSMWFQTNNTDGKICISDRGENCNTVGRYTSSTSTDTSELTGAALTYLPPAS